MAFHASTRLLLACALPLALAACGKTSPVATMSATNLSAASANTAQVAELDDDQAPLLSEQPVAPSREIVTGEGPAAAAHGSTDEATSQFILDPYRPYGVGVSGQSSSAITLQWRTDLNSKATVYYGKVGVFGFRGYTHVWQVNDSRKVHQTTITGLNRWSKYRIMVVGLAPLGFQFPTWEIEAKTKLFGN